MVILIVDVSLVITKIVFTKLFELCERRNLVFLCLENYGNRNHCPCCTLFSLHIKTYAVKITFGEFLFLWSIESPIRHLFHKKFHQYLWSCYKAQFVSRQTQPFYSKCNHCHSRKDLSIMVPTQIQEIYFFQDFGRVQGNNFICPKVWICKISFWLREKIFFYVNGNWEISGDFKNIFLFDWKPFIPMVALVVNGCVCKTTNMGEIA